jgi:hypothetical protein
VRVMLFKSRRLSDGELCYPCLCESLMVRDIVFISVLVSVDKL